MTAAILAAWLLLAPPEADEADGLAEALTGHLAAVWRACAR